MDAARSGELDLVVGIQGGGHNGIDVYAEQVAAAAASAGHRVTLLVTTPRVARGVRRRAGPAIEVVDLGLSEPGPLGRLTDRVSYRHMVARSLSATRRALARLGRHFDLAHLNRPPFAEGLRPFARRVVVAAWFHPHAPLARLGETWRHDRGPLPRRLALTAKSLFFYLGDARGFASADRVVTPTEALAAALRDQGYDAVACPPPVHLRPARPLPEVPPRDRRERRLLAVAGDLSHPRKNLGDAVDALARLASAGRSVRLELVGGHPEPLLARARRLGVERQLLVRGPLPPGAVHAAMAAADALVFPSRYEEWGYVAVESLLSGTPVVAYPVYPFAEMLAGGLGEVAHAETVPALATAIARILDVAPDPDRARRAAERYGDAAVGRRLTELWRAALSHAPREAAAERASVAPPSA